MTIDERQTEIQDFQPPFPRVAIYRDHFAVASAKKPGVCGQGQEDALCGRAKRGVPGTDRSRLHGPREVTVNASYDLQIRAKDRTSRLMQPR
jgi:hypothetical protein